VALQSASGVLTQSVFDVLRECHRKVMSGQLPNGSCAALNPADVAPATQALQLAITNSCASTGHSPSAFGYRACPPPCESIPEGPLAVCSAGLVGSCQRDRDCDTAVDAGDGVCGDWSTMNACTACQAKAAGLAAIEAAYGEVADEQALPGAAENCQNTIGNSIATVLAAELKDVARCQKSIDEFKLLLPNDTPKCKDADPKSKRARARESVVPDLMTNCNTPAALAPLDTCATNPPGLRNCLPRIVRRLVAEVSDAAAPEGMCGDGKRGFHETCDDSNAIDGDGCDSNCTLTACGNGIITSGEECDDGNTVDGDGCSSGCQSEPQPCAPQTCSNFSFDCSALFPGDCVCLGAAEGGGGSCVNNFNCATAQPCNTSLECPPGETCYRDTCCAPPGAGVCGPQKCKAQ
jgi:cysteine-rich repeat protein